MKWHFVPLKFGCKITTENAVRKGFSVQLCPHFVIIRQYGQDFRYLIDCQAGKLLFRVGLYFGISKIWTARAVFIQKILNRQV